MTRPSYPFTAIVGQEELKTALLLAAVDWRLGVLLRGDKGTGKTTAARALAELLPEPAHFINLPVGVTEDRLLGGLDLARTIEGKPGLRRGLLSEANQGVLYIDEVNLLPDHLADALLDAAATGVHTLEREGFSAVEESRFVLAGSMNPEEGALRPQLLDRFALVVDVHGSRDPHERREVIERRIAYDADPILFVENWTTEQARLRKQIVAARNGLSTVHLSGAILDRIAQLVCDRNVTSLRADLAIARASCARAALLGSQFVREEDVDAIFPLALAHRTRKVHPPASSAAPPESTKPTEQSEGARQAGEKNFLSVPVEAPVIHMAGGMRTSGNAPARTSPAPGPVISTRKAEAPRELDFRSSVVEAIARTGAPQPSNEHLREKVRKPVAGARYLFVVDSSGSHAAGERMRVVKGAAVGLIEKSVHRRDEVAVISFRGTSAEVLVEPTREVETVASALEYLPTGGRTPLAHALVLAKKLVNERTLLVLLTDGRANVPLTAGDPWEDALRAASELACSMLVVDTEQSISRGGKAKELAASVHADCVSLEDFKSGLDLTTLLAIEPHKSL